MSSDYQLEDTVYLPFTTRAFATGIPTALVSGVVDIYEDVTATPIITAETLTVSLNGHAGFNMITVTATAATGFGAGQSYTAILDAGTVDSVSVIGEVVAHFTLDKSGAALDLANGTDGLSALKTLIDAIPTTAMRGTDNAALASVVGALNDGAAADEVTTADTLMQYVKQLINILIGAPGIVTLKAAAAPASGVSLSEMIRAIYDDSNELQTDWVNGGRLDLLLDAIPTTAMRGTDNAALASVVGALNDAAAADEVTTADTLVQYIKQLINILIGAPGIVTLKAAAAPASGVSLSEMIRAIYDDSNSLDGTKIPDTISLANINAEVDTALDTTIAELSQGVPDVTPTVRTALMLMYMALRNKLDVATSATDTLEVHNDAGTRIAQKLLTDDGSDYSEAKMTSGI